MKIDFHILDDNRLPRALHYACELIEKIYADQEQVYIHTSNQSDAERLDALLWTYRDDSFLPHNLFKPDDECPPPIQIGWGEPPPQQSQVLLNLSQQIPAFYKQFKRVIEIVIADPSVQQLARERFKQYREHGCEMNTFKIK